MILQTTGWKTNLNITNLMKIGIAFAVKRNTDWNTCRKQNRNKLESWWLVGSSLSVKTFDASQKVVVSIYKIYTIHTFYITCISLSDIYSPWNSVINSYVDCRIKLFKFLMRNYRDPSPISTTKLFNFHNVAYVL